MGPDSAVTMRTVLYGKKAANLYTQAFVQNTQARALYQESRTPTTAPTTPRPTTTGAVPATSGTTSTTATKQLELARRRRWHSAYVSGSVLGVQHDRLRLNDGIEGACGFPFPASRSRSC